MYRIENNSAHNVTINGRVILPFQSKTFTVLEDMSAVNKLISSQQISIFITTEPTITEVVNPVEEDKKVESVVKPVNTKKKVTKDSNTTEDNINNNESMKGDLSNATDKD